MRACARESARGAVKAGFRVLPIPYGSVEASLRLGLHGAENPHALRNDALGRLEHRSTIFRRQAPVVVHSVGAPHPIAGPRRTRHVGRTSIGAERPPENRAPLRAASTDVSPPQSVRGSPSRTDTISPVFAERDRLDDLLVGGDRPACRVKKAQPDRMVQPF